MSLIHGGSSLNSNHSTSTSSLQNGSTVGAAYSSQMTNSMILNASNDDFDESPTKPSYFINASSLDHQSTSSGDGYINHHQSSHHGHHHEDQNEEDEHDEEENEDIEDEEQTDATFDNELFSSALDDHHFESLIDPSTTVVSGTGNGSVSGGVHMHTNGTDSSTSPSANESYFSGS